MRLIFGNFSQICPFLSAFKGFCQKRIVVFIANCIFFTSLNGNISPRRL